MDAVGGPAERVVPEAEQRRLVDRGHEPHVAAVTPVAAVGTAPVHVGLAAPRDRSGSPVAGARVELRLVDEAGHGGKAYEPSSRRARWPTSARARSPSTVVHCPAFDDLVPAHPDVGHEVARAGPHEVPQQLGVTYGRREPRVIGPQPDDVRRPPDLERTDGEPQRLGTAAGGQS